MAEGNSSPNSYICFGDFDYVTGSCDQTHDYADIRDSLFDECVNNSTRICRHENPGIQIETNVEVKTEIECSANDKEYGCIISTNVNNNNDQSNKTQTSDTTLKQHRVENNTKLKEYCNTSRRSGTEALHRQTFRHKQYTHSVCTPYKQGVTNHMCFGDFDYAIGTRDETQDNANTKCSLNRDNGLRCYEKSREKDTGNAVSQNEQIKIGQNYVGKSEKGGRLHSSVQWDRNKCERTNWRRRNTDRESEPFGWERKKSDQRIQSETTQDSIAQHDRKDERWKKDNVFQHTHRFNADNYRGCKRITKEMQRKTNDTMMSEDLEICQKPNKNIGCTDNLYKQKENRQYPLTTTNRFKHRQDNALFSTQFLNKLVENEPSKIVMTLSNQDAQFKQCLLQSSKDPDLLRSLLHVLAKAFLCNSLSRMIISIFATTKEVRFFDTVALYLVDLQADTSENEQENITDQLRDILSIISEMTIKSPSSFETFSRIQITLGKLIDSDQASSCLIGDDVLSDFKEYSKNKDRITKCQRMKPKNTLTSEDREQPPEDYRDIEVFPQKEEIQTTLDPFLRKNKVEGGYIDLNHYLDVQFRLLREDFIGPLREGISEYILARQEGQMHPRVQDVRVYSNVQFVDPKYDKSGISYTLQFEVTPRLERLNWKSSKRLIYGSLVCLSSDNFNTVYFASVVDRQDEFIKMGMLSVRFEHDQRTVKSLIKGRFTMVETTAYFESYRHVLTALQRFRPGDLPFEKYIVQCETQIKPPSYLSEDSVYDLRPLVDESFVLRADQRLKHSGHVINGQRELSFSSESQAANDVKVSDSNSWPSAHLLHLDESQFTAIHKALTQEFAIIQGPPGTGKTYIGLKIVKALLHNKSLWSSLPETKSKDEGPMLIVCFTNHALDQFLEGIRQFFKGDVVRVGGQSKSDTLKDCNLKSYHQTFRDSRNASKELYQGRIKSMKEYDEVKHRIGALLNKITVCKRNILHERFLQPYIGKGTYFSLTADLRQTADHRRYGSKFSWIVKWLGIGSLKTKGIHRTKTNTTQKQCTRNTAVEMIDVQDESELLQAERRLDIDDNADEENSQKANHNTFDIESVAYHVDFEKPENMDKEQWEEKLKQRKNINRQIEQNIALPDIMSEEEAENVKNVWKLRSLDKWRLYRLWIQRLTFEIRQEIESYEDEFDTCAMRFREMDMQEDKEILKRSTVIGMTTTGAARYQAVLREIRPKIIIVEEAAEVLEAHIIATLSEGCEHLILIGDHKQLKPTPTMYRLANKFNLDLSLFERMINNGVNYNCLQLQHRMRPEIAELLHHIYENLQDHDDVKEYPDVKGISTNIFLINHNKIETEAEESRSHSNIFEAEYSVALCRYLLLQGYHREQITILTTYSGQLFCLQKLMPKDEWLGVKVRVVDNYQGEENDIIILSLVRSNRQGNIGFLKTENRICVALSRAKIGCYILGNFDLLANKSKLWKGIVSDMKKNNQIGEGLRLYCRNHLNDDAIVSKHGSDFQKAPEGGCSKMCDVRLPCGHVCAMFCHVQDTDHSIYKCRKACTIILCERNHLCPKTCFEDCGKCMVPISRQIPKCGHEQPVPCHMDPGDFTCRDICETLLRCGHDCTNACGNPHTLHCKVMVEKTWPCNNISSVMCYKFDKALCPNPCNAVLSCDHICSGTCGICFNGRLHKQCSMKCKRILVCGHECTGNCNSCPPCSRPCENRCKHSTCKHYCGEPCSPCMEPCAWRCRHYACYKRCSEPCNRPRCNRPCIEMLLCNHPCIGLCGEPCPPYCRICDRDIVTTIIFGKEDKKGSRFVFLEDCGHIAESRAMDMFMSTMPEDKNTSTLIKLKGCPICTTPIRKSYRYGDLINKVLQDIEKVKQTILGGSKEIEDSKTHVRQTLASRRKLVVQKTAYNYHLELRRYNEYRIVSAIKQITEQNQKEFERVVTQMSNSWMRIQTKRHTSKDKDDVKRFFDHLLGWVKQNREHLTEQEVTDFQREILRGNLHMKLEHTQKCIERSGKTHESVEDVENIKGVLTAYERFTEDKEKEAMSVYEKLRKLTSIEGLGIYEDERAMIVKAMRLSKGHWFKCSNNHVYAIGDCGGANQEGECPECKAKIGGKRHRLNDGNVLAPEMDGAEFAAYSEEANNMANFQLHDLQ